MEYRKLGKSGIEVSALSFGSWLTFGKQIGDTTAKDLMHYAYDHGVNFFDNAEIYARGESERVMGQILKESGWRRDSYVVSSKAYFGDGNRGPNQTGLSRKHLVEACNAALERLQVEYLDLFFCHRPDKKTPMEETVWTMHQLIMQGKILYWGTSERSAQEIMEAHMVARQFNLIPPTMEQPQYNMLVREKFEVEYAKLFRDYGMGTTIWSPLASGILTGKYNDGFPEDTRLNLEGMEWLRDRVYQEEALGKIRQLTALAGELGTSMAKLALAWCVKNPNVSTVILGASKLYQLEENLTALEVVPLLDGSVMERIEEILANKPVPPMW